MGSFIIFKYLLFMRGGVSKLTGNTTAKGVPARGTTNNNTNQAQRGSDPRHISREFKY